MFKAQRFDTRDVDLLSCYPYLNVPISCASSQHPRERKEIWAFICIRFFLFVLGVFLLSMQNRPKRITTGSKQMYGKCHPSNMSMQMDYGCCLLLKNLLLLSLGFSQVKLDNIKFHK